MHYLLSKSVFVELRRWRHVNDIGLRQADNGCLSVSRLPDNVGEGICQSILLYRCSIRHDGVAGEFQFNLLFIRLSDRGQSVRHLEFTSLHRLESSRINLVEFHVNFIDDILPGNSCKLPSTCSISHGTLYHHWFGEKISFLNRSEVKKETPSFKEKDVGSHFIIYQVFGSLRMAESKRSVRRTWAWMAIIIARIIGVAEEFVIVRP